MSAMDEPADVLVVGAGFAGLALEGEDVSRLGGCCATRPITGCAQRVRRSLTVSAEG
jgi:hypothetical protein